MRVRDTYETFEQLPCIGCESHAPQFWKLCVGSEGWGVLIQNLCDAAQRCFARNSVTCVHDFLRFIKVQGSSVWRFLVNRHGCTPCMIQQAFGICVQACGVLTYHVPEIGRSLDFANYTKTATNCVHSWLASTTMVM